MTQLIEVTERFIRDGLGSPAVGTQGSADPVVRLYGNHRARYAIGLPRFDDSLASVRFQRTINGTDERAEAVGPGRHRLPDRCFGAGRLD
jgi:hypothetical protein